MEEEAHLHVHSSYIQHHFLLLDEPKIPLITVEAHTTYHCDINHVISYYAYLGFEWPDNLLWFRRHFFGHDANGRVTRSTFY
ncbi:hypothetical protein GmHk_17G049426 [Glycine max]|nr:hypothetical protein GmHk_17G049426 [Glycine max]